MPGPYVPMGWGDQAAGWGQVEARGGRPAGQEPELVPEPEPEPEPARQLTGAEEQDQEEGDSVARDRTEEGQSTNEVQKEINEQAEDGVDYAKLEGSGNEIKVMLVESKRFGKGVLQRDAKNRLMWRALLGDGKRADIVQKLLRYLHSGAELGGKPLGEAEVEKYCNKIIASLDEIGAKPVELKEFKDETAVKKENDERVMSNLEKLLERTVSIIEEKDKNGGAKKKKEKEKEEDKARREPLAMQVTPGSGRQRKRTKWKSSTPVLLDNKGRPATLGGLSAKLFDSDDDKPKKDKEKKASGKAKPKSDSEEDGEEDDDEGSEGSSTEADEEEENPRMTNPALGECDRYFDALQRKAEEADKKYEQKTKKRLVKYDPKDPLSGMDQQYANNTGAVPFNVDLDVGKVG